MIYNPRLEADPGTRPAQLIEDNLTGRLYDAA